MKNQSRILTSLLLGLAALQGCSSVEQKPSAETQPVALAAAPQAACEAKCPAGEKPAEKPVATEKSAALPDRYTVVAGDTLSTIAEKKEVYGDARLWPLLQRANSTQVGPDNLLSIGQVLNINRHFSTEEKTALIGKARAASPAAAQTTTTQSPAAAVPSAAPVVAATTSTETKAPSAPAESAKQAVKTGDTLNAARRAFAAGDLPWAVYYYSAHLNTQNKDANAWGELGNVFFAAGDLPDSAQAYFNAASLLIDQGQTARAIQLVPAIELGNPGLSEAIHSRLTSVRK